jgi:hypothetical protein
MTTTAAKRSAQQDATLDLRLILNPGDTVYTILRHVSASGMTRYISTVIVQNGQPRDISYLVAQAIGSPLSGNRNHEGVKVGGCGMDMGFHLVYSLSRALFGGDSRTSNEDAGYALPQRWL